jgi:hypothetical protein
MGHFTGAIGVSPAQRLFCMAKMRYFRATGVIFPKVSFTLDVILRHMGHYFAIGSE